MILEVGGSYVKTWSNLGTSYANYTLLWLQRGHDQGEVHQQPEQPV